MRSYWVRSRYIDIRALKPCFVPAQGTCARPSGLAMLACDQMSVQNPHPQQSKRTRCSSGMIGVISTLCTKSFVHCGHGIETVPRSTISVVIRSNISVLIFAMADHSCRSLHIASFYLQSGKSTLPTSLPCLMCRSCSSSIRACMTDGVSITICTHFQVSGCPYLSTYFNTF